MQLQRLRFASTFPQGRRSMEREEIHREIADIDRELTRVLGSAELPRLNSRAFPTGTYILTLLALAWWMFGGEAPYVSQYYGRFGEWGLYAAGVLALLALCGTVSWILRPRGGMPAEYRTATEKSRDLQERRRELQARLRELED